MPTGTSISSGPSRRRIAVVGTGVSGLVAAYRLAPLHDVHVYEASARVGGHTNTVAVDAEDGVHHIDTGFIVHNVLTYRVLCRLFRELAVPVRDTKMSFSVRSEATGLEYSSTGLDGLFAQRKNLVDRSHWRMIADVQRWNRGAQRVLREVPEDVTLGEHLAREAYSSAFIERFIVPMGAAIWSTDADRMLEFPATYFVRFLDNHRMLEPLDQPTWRVVVGGSHEYVKRMTRGFSDKIRLETGVVGIERADDHVLVHDTRGGTERFDDVVIAAHSDQALKMLRDPSPEERAILGDMTYQPNEAVLHTDTRVLPRSKRAWASWNYRIAREPSEGVAVSYSMNILQGLTSREHYVVSLNEHGLDPEKVIQRIRYEHPLFTTKSVAAQKQRHLVCGQRRTHYAGAYWGFGFHEDGARSGLEVARRFGAPA